MLKQLPAQWCSFLTSAPCGATLGPEPLPLGNTCESEPHTPKDITHHASCPQALLQPSHDIPQFLSVRDTPATASFSPRDGCVLKLGPCPDWGAWPIAPRLLGNEWRPRRCAGRTHENVILRAGFRSQVLLCPVKSNPQCLCWQRVCSSSGQDNPLVGTSLPWNSFPLREDQTHHVHHYSTVFTGRNRGRIAASSRVNTWMRHMTNGK